MSRELDLIAQEYKSKKATVMRKDLSLYRTSITIAASGFLRAIETECKRQNQSSIMIIAIIPELDKKEQNRIRKET